MKSKSTAVAKTLEEIQLDLSALYDQVRDGEVELKIASELANVVGKYLKAEQLRLAREVFLSRGGRLRMAKAAAVRLIRAA